MIEKDSKKRIEILLDELKHTKYSLSIALGYVNGSVFHNILNGRNGISTGLANKVVDKFPQINYRWLLRGEGSMLVEPKENLVNNPLLERIELLERLCKGQDAKIELLKLDLENLKNRLKK